jgi:hypothetical protein
VLFEDFENLNIILYNIFIRVLIFGFNKVDKHDSIFHYDFVVALSLCALKAFQVQRPPIHIHTRTQYIIQQRCKFNLLVDILGAVTLDDQRCCWVFLLNLRAMANLCYPHFASGTENAACDSEDRGDTADFNHPPESRLMISFIRCISCGAAKRISQFGPKLLYTSRLAHHEKFEADTPVAKKCAAIRRENAFIS